MSEVERVALGAVFVLVTMSLVMAMVVAHDVFIELWWDVVRHPGTWGLALFAMGFVVMWVERSERRDEQ